MHMIARQWWYKCMSSVLYIVSGSNRVAFFMVAYLTYTLMKCIGLIISSKTVVKGVTCV